MNKLWNIADLIDLHFFFQADEELRRREGEAALAKRDRIIYVAKIEPQLGKMDDIPPRILVRKWLAMRRLQYRQERGHEGQVLPGTLWQEMALLCRGLVFCCGLLAGAGLAGSLLLYAGTMPLNVAVYFGLFVVLQLVMIGLQGGLFVYRRLRRLPMESTALYALIGRLLMRGMDGMRRLVQRNLSGQRRLDLTALLGGVRQRKELAALLIWPAFILVQLGGIGFNLGVIGATLAKVTFADIAFAWQSSLQLSAELVASLVRWIALPWSWLVPHAYPSLAQIQGSQVVLKEGMAHLATADLVSWWPFLCCAVVTYGLLPRIGLLMLGLVGQRRALDALHFATLSIRPLLQRMTTPRIDTNGERESTGQGRSITRPPAESVEPGGPGRGMEPAAPPAASAPAVHDAPTVLLIADELYDECPQELLVERLRSQWGHGRVECVRHGQPGAPLAEALLPLRTAVEQGGLGSVLLLQEAWQPPLKETELLLRALRDIAGEHTPLTVVLIGKPTPQTILTPVDPEQLRVWRQKMRAVGDPCLEVQPLVQP